MVVGGFERSSEDGVGFNLISDLAMTGDAE